MELFFKKYFWTVNLAFLALVALIAAGTVNLFVEASLAPVPSGRNRGKLNFWAKASPCIAGRAKRDGQPGRSGPPAKAMPARQIGWSPVASITRVGKHISPSSSRKGRAGRSSTLTMAFTSQIPRATRTAAATGGTPAV